jgi:hypothetical protein
MHPRIETYLLGQRFAGVEAEVCADGVRYHVTIVRRVKGQLQIEQTFHQLRSADQLPKDALADIPILLTITGKGVLHRVVQSDRDTASEVLVRKAIPDIVHSDFMFQTVFNETSGHIVSIARRSLVEEIQQQIAPYGTVINTDVGAVNTQFIHALLEKETIVCGHHQLQFNASGLKSVTWNESLHNDDSIALKGETIPAQALIGFSSVVKLLLTHNDNREFAEYLQRRLFRFTTRTALAGLLLLLLINYLSFSSYRSLAEELQSRPEARTELAAQRNALRTKVSEQRTFLTSTGLLEEAPFAWYADQLAHEMPAGIQLTQMNFSPRVKLAAEDSIGFSNGMLQLSGTCNESIQLNTWVQQLKSRSWVRTAAIVSYEQNRAQANGVFHLQLDLR